MERALFKGWTENQLRAAFAAAEAGRLPSGRLPKDCAFWRDLAYIERLTGGMATRPTP